MPRRLIQGVALAAAAAVAVGVAGCGGEDVDRDALADKLRNETGLGFQTPIEGAELDCVVDVVIDHSDGGDLNDYVAGDITFGEVGVNDENEAAADLLACMPE